MAIVPRYVQDVSTRPELQQSLTTRASADDMGAAVGRGLGAVSQGLGQAAQAAAQIQALDDEAIVKERDNALAARLREMQYGEGGYMTLSGRAAVEARDRFEGELERVRTEVGGDLTPSQAAMFNRASTARVSSILDRSIVHQANERKAWYNDASTQRLDTFSQDALAGYRDPNTVMRNIAAGQAELRSMAELQGWDADALANREAEFISGVHKNVVMRMAQDDPIAADAYRQSVEGSLRGSDRFDLERTLAAPLLQARATGVAEGILSGAFVEATQPVPPSLEDELSEAGVPNAADVAAGARMTGIAPYIPGRGQASMTGRVDYMDAARSMIGMNERADSGVISDFIKSFSGIEIDPAQTAWCAAFVNGVLGAGGIDGTGQLNARSFLNFGTAVSEPRVGDVVVFSRGDPDGWQGHVGFFKGYDANGNILVLGGNQSDGVSVASYSADTLLGVRRPSQGVVGDQVPVNYTPVGLAHIEQQLAGIEDPQLRDAARQQIMRTVEAQNRIMRQEREQVQQGAESWVIANPGVTPDNLPVEMQQALGVSGMNTLWSWTDSVTSRGEPSTDDVILYELQTMYATDPEGFSQADLFQYRDRLSDSDWKTVTGWRQTALTDRRTASDQGANLTSAFSQASTALEGLGISTTGLQGSRRTEAAQRVARFNNSLSAQISEFQGREGRPPNQAEVQTLINRLLLPIVIEEPGSLWGTSQTTGNFLFEADTVANAANVSVSVDYANIPRSLRIEIEADLSEELGRNPSEAEVSARYNQVIEDTIRGNN
jgi:uncharacterized protein (TIGR02594 family)